ncbi:MAG: T-protein [Candidatus Daviesbacteria bacterium GW2011_GWA2_38_24]|uniref:T-protein n=1 Tax=Candidatus Daviesbacteria bacterium GW2011_GWA2_38_24 TaxID=1618422 RepID=A0A0G0JKH4_9BACT|nr:MAG: T-protein [Candidatus Daviesbacteria bacterium GW2011_GWA2_38_24]KKQ78631.1 MAG: T-protein [Candidatus Daviesbacteria bacterium GW2011_GWA1_38_7]OGE23898.1 MAG: hypothetical protein A2688_02200 [Candidatus Daviesbacteria bacterium RIFCSPHIGHO2_01_FULL_38_8]
MDLTKLRKEIDQVDARLLELISKRVSVVKKIGEYKKQVGKPIRDPQREQERIDTLAKQGQKLGLGRKSIEKIWRTFFEVSYTIEESKGAKNE